MMYEFLRHSIIKTTNPIVCHPLEILFILLLLTKKTLPKRKIFYFKPTDSLNQNVHFLTEPYSFPQTCLQAKQGINVKHVECGERKHIIDFISIFISEQTKLVFAQDCFSEVI